MWGELPKVPAKAGASDISGAGSVAASGKWSGKCCCKWGQVPKVLADSEAPDTIGPGSVVKSEAVSAKRQHRWQGKGREDAHRIRK